MTLPLPTIRAWLFDLDGTLIDTDDQAMMRLQKRLHLFGHWSRGIARRLVMWSEGPTNALVTLFDLLGLDSLLFALNQRIGWKDDDGFHIIPGVQPMLRALAQHYTLGIVSTRSREAAHAFLEQYHLKELFSIVVTREDTERLKPHPEPLLYAAQRLQLKPEACVMVGDTPVDIRAARRAGAWSLGVLCGFGDVNDLRRAGSHLILPSTADILKLLEP